MTTYNTYQEAKIANPESEIVTTGTGWIYDSELKGKFEKLDHHALGDSSWIVCSPADYCMTFEEFLNNGNEFVDGDVAIMTNGTVVTVGAVGCKPHNFNQNRHRNNKRYILRATAFKEIASAEGEASRKAMADTLDNEIAELQNKPRTKVEYEEFSLDGWDIWQSLKAYQESNEKWFYKVDDLYFEIIEWFNLAEVLRAGENVYIKFERPIKWHEDAIEFAQQCKGVNTAVYIPEYDAIDIDGSMTREEACDYARILLEQEGE